MASSVERGDHGDEETRVPLVDAVEIGALVAVPAAGFGAVTSLGAGEPTIGLVFGAIVGSFLGMIRRTLYAVRTPEGIERRLHRFETSEKPTAVARLANLDVDPRYELLVGGGCALVGVAALVSVPPFAADDAAAAVRLLALALFGLIGALGAIGSYYLR